MQSRAVIHNGYPVLEIVIDGKTARLGFDNKLTMLDMGYLYLGSAFEGDPEYTHVLPEDKEDNRGEMVLEGFTSDPEIIAGFREWLKSR